MYSKYFQNDKCFVMQPCELSSGKLGQQDHMFKVIFDSAYENLFFNIQIYFRT